VIEPLESSDVVSKLGSHIVDVELIRIDSDSLMFSGINKLLLTDCYYILSGGVVFSVSRDGKQLGRVGNVGRGPGEYLSIKDIALSLDNKELWCLDSDNSVLRYSIPELKFIAKIVPSNDTGYVRALVPMEGNTLGLYIPNPRNRELLDGVKEKFYCLRIYDMNGIEVGKDLLWTGFNINSGFSVPISFSDHGRSVLSPEGSVPSIVYENGKESGRLQFDFGKKNIPDTFFSSGDPWSKITELFMMDCYKLTSSVYFMDGGMYLRSFGEDSSSWNFYLNEDGSKGFRWRSEPMMTPPIFALASEGGYLYFAYDDYGQIPEGTEKDPLKRVVLSRFGFPAHPVMECLIKVKFE